MRLVTTCVASVFLMITLFFLLTEHRAHVYGILPYLLLLLCPLMHLFMHRGHGMHDAGGSGDHENSPRRSKGGPV